MYTNFTNSDVVIGLIEDVDMSRIRQCQRTSTREAINDEDILRLSNSIRQRGLLQPIVVRLAKEDEEDNKQFEIVAGNRRYLACKSIGLRKILCHVVELDDKEAFEISLIENIQRKTLQPLEEARAFRIYVQKRGWGGISELAFKIGKSATYVARRIKLLEFPEEILQNIANHEMDPSTAEELLGIHDLEKRNRLAREAVEHSWSSRRVRQSIKVYKGGSSVYDTEGETEDPWNGENKIKQIDERTNRAFDKSIISLKIAMKRIAEIMNSVEDNWIIYELLMQHRNMLHHQIDILIKQKNRL